MGGGQGRIFGILLGDINGSVLRMQIVKFTEAVMGIESLLAWEWKGIDAISCFPI